ncbi:MAG: hypothetical protein ACE5FH_07980, partial [Candidatus Zixiibacteriota bacterium]
MHNCNQPRTSMSSLAIFGCLVLALCGFTSPETHSAVPAVMSYQGRLADTLGNPIDTIVPITFSIAADSLGSNVVWSETHSSVDMRRGLFSVMLGSEVPIPATTFDGLQKWLFVAVDGNLPGPPVPVISNAYAMRAAIADTALFALAGGNTDTAIFSYRSDTATYALNAPQADSVLYA